VYAITYIFDLRPVLQMEVGIEDCLHIEFEYEKGAYGLHDVVLGQIYFLLVRIRLKHMELEIRRREIVGVGAAARSEAETVAKYEIMDGAPAKGEVIPIRLDLSPYDLSPTFGDVHNRFSVRYMLNLVLVDEEDRRYFKQQEVQLFRDRPGDGGRPFLVSPSTIFRHTAPAAGLAEVGAEQDE
jgi:vacuolar protein sorting-associated protein 26